MDLAGRHDTIADTPVLVLLGEIDLATLPVLHQHLQRLVTEHRGATVIVDLDGVQALADSGLGLLLGAAGQARQSGGDLVVVSSQQRQLDRFRLTGLDRAITVRSSVTGAG